MKEDACDVVVVVGGGATGLSAALVLGRARRRVAVIDAGAPRNAPDAHMHGFLSRDGMPPADLLAEGRDEVTGYGVELVNDQVLRQWSDDVVFFVHTYDLMPAEQRQLEAPRIRVVSGEVARLVVEDDRLTGVELIDGRVVARTAVFVRPGSLPHDDGLLAGLGCGA